MVDAEKKTSLKIYVIMPFSQTDGVRTKDYWDEHFSDFICSKIREVTDIDPLLSEFEWDIQRSSAVKGGPLNYEIVWDLLHSQFVVADLTDLNHNVLYELGVRHAFTAAFGSKRTIMIQDESVFKLPFDFANYAVIKYKKDKIDTWKREITDRLRSCIESYNYRDNPVSMTFAQHGFSFQEQSSQEQAVEKFKSALDMIERMTSLGFDVKWIQDLLTQSMLNSMKEKHPSPKSKDK